MKRLGMDHHFEAIWRATIDIEGDAPFPEGKLDMLREVQRQTGLAHHEILMVGDGKKDMESTHDGEQKFVGLGLTLSDPKNVEILRQAGADFLLNTIEFFDQFWQGLNLQKGSNNHELPILTAS